jgi:hypothetical protein
MPWTTVLDHRHSHPLGLFQGRNLLHHCVGIAAPANIVTHDEKMMFGVLLGCAVSACVAIP